VDPTGIVYVLSREKLIALKLSDGTLIWTNNVVSMSRGSPIIATSMTASYLLVDSTTNYQQIYRGSGCQNNGTCNDNFICDCQENYYGAACATFCQANITCTQAGICTEAGTCHCNGSYYGPNCGKFCSTADDEKRNCFFGNCLATGDCNCSLNYWNHDCNVYCQDTETCHYPNGTCSTTDGSCQCNNTAFGFFAAKVYGGENCLLVPHIGFIAFLVGLIGILLLCGGIALCCCCEKSRKLERDQFSLLTTNEDKRR